MYDDEKENVVDFYIKQHLFEQAMLEWKKVNKQLKVTNTDRNRSRYCGDCIRVCAAGSNNSSGYVQCALDGSSVVLGQRCPKNKFNLRFYD